jgi:hypothetical protein
LFVIDETSVLEIFYSNNRRCYLINLQF